MLCFFTLENFNLLRSLFHLPSLILHSALAVIGNVCNADKRLQNTTMFWYEVFKQNLQKTKWQLTPLCDEIAATL